MSNKTKLSKWLTISVYDRACSAIFQWCNRLNAVQYANDFIVQRTDPAYIGMDMVHFIHLDDESDCIAYEDFRANLVHVVPVPKSVRELPGLKYIVLHISDGKLAGITPFAVKSDAINEANYIVKSAVEEAKQKGYYDGDETDKDEHCLMDSRANTFEAYDWSVREWCMLLNVNDIRVGSV